MQSRKKEPQIVLPKKIPVKKFPVKKQQQQAVAAPPPPAAVSGTAASGAAVGVSLWAATRGVFRFIRQR